MSGRSLLIFLYLPPARVFIGVGSKEGRVPEMFKKKASKQKVRVLFVEQKNDFASQMAEYFTRQLYDDMYEIYSAGPEKDIMDCDMISSMYDSGEDIRRQVSKDFKDRDYLREDEDYDVVIYMDKPTFDEWSGKTPWKGKQFLAQIRQRSEYTATDDLELFNEYVASMNEVKEWVRVNLKDPEALKTMVVA